MAPPGWTPSPAFAPPPPQPAGPATPSGADAAVRWRIRAARIDNILVTGAYLALCVLLHWNASTIGHLLVFGLMGIGYHFVLEANGGQTLGKRRYGIQVVGIDGAPAGPRAIAIRSLLRIVDQLPVSYVSGLISMLRTGPGRRQRIGDIAAGTVVVAVDGRSVRDGTPGWMLPAATLFAVAVSALAVAGVLRGGSQSLTGRQACNTPSAVQNPLGGCAR